MKLPCFGRGGQVGRAAAGACAWALLVPQAHAHLLSTGLGPVYDGILHFTLTPEDLMPALALAIFAGLRGAEHARRVIFVLPLTWLLAGLCGTLLGVSLPAFFSNALTWLPLLVLGGLIAADIRLTAARTTALAAVLGIFLGFANGSSMAQTGSGMRGIFGIVCAVFCGHKSCCGVRLCVAIGLAARCMACCGELDCGQWAAIAGLVFTLGGFKNDRKKWL